MAIEYSRPYLYPKQERAFFNPCRFSFIEASTKAGKTVGAIAWIIEQALKGPPHSNHWWVAPVSDQARIAFTRVKNNLTQGAFTSNESPTPRITLPSNTYIWFKSADNPDSLYGEDVFSAVMDEASRAKDDAWHALRSTLTATQGPLRCIGNVKGRLNWFWRQCRLAETGQYPDMYWDKITVLDAIAAGVIPASELESAKRDLPEHVFRELYMAEAADDSGNPFGLDHIVACVRPLSVGKPVAFGLDLAKKNDFLVLIALDSSGHVCGFWRWQGRPWRDSIREVHRIVGEDVPCLVDSTGLGDPVLEELQVDHGNFYGYMFTAASKQRLMEGLAVSIQSHEIFYPDGPIRQELETFEYALSRTGVRYSAPDGFHDDCVCSLALARQQWTETEPGQNIIGAMGIEARGLALTQARIPDLRAELKAQTLDLMPWRQATPAFDLDNELTELYEETLKAHPTFAQQAYCQGCGKALGQALTQVSDGEFVWHPECVGLMRAA